MRQTETETLLSPAAMKPQRRIEIAERKSESQAAEPQRMLICREA